MYNYCLFLPATALHKVLHISSNTKVFLERRGALLFQQKVAANLLDYIPLPGGELCSRG